MGAAVESLKSIIDSDECHDIAWKDLLPRQIEAADELFQERVGQVKLLAHRAEDTGVRTVKSLNDIVPLLFAHTSYKSYPESWFVEGKWDRMGQWLNTLMPGRAPKLDRLAADLDDWVAQMADVGFFLACSSGTTGKCSILPSVQKDLDFVRHQMFQAMVWGMGTKPSRQFSGFALTPMPDNARSNISMEDVKPAFFSTYRPFPGERIKPGQVSKMVALRRSIADGTAKPGDIAAFEQLSKDREKAMNDALVTTADAIIEARGGPIFVQGMPATMWQISQMVRDKGYSGRDFHPDNSLLMAGGFKGVAAPGDAVKQVFDTFNVSYEHSFQFYSMQELNTVAPRCPAGRYHMPPWLMLLVLDESGENLIDPPAGEFEGRAAFMDLSLNGRWAGIITGDKVNADFGRCACGHEGPTVGLQITRYSELPGGDKITCAGTLDAYVRGAA